MENIILSPLTVFIVPGGQETVSVNVTNESAIVDHFTMEVEGLPDGWATPPPGSMPLMPNQETGFQVVIGPLPPTAPAGTYPYRVRLRSTSNLGVEARGYGNLHVRPVYGFMVTLNPTRLKNGGICRLHIANTGNGEQRFAVAAHDTEGRLHIDAPAEAVVIAAGKDAAVDLRVNPLARPITGKSQDCAFAVQVRPEQGELQAPVGRVEVTPYISRRIVIIALLLLAVAVALLGSGLGRISQAGQTAATATIDAFSQEQADIAGTAEMLLDEDGDGLPLAIELELGTNPTKFDTDDDGLADGVEFTKDRVRFTDPLDVDTDGDDLADGAERQCNPDYDGEARGQCTNPENRDSDGDGIQDNVDPDSSAFPTHTPIPPDNRFEDPSFEASTLTWLDSLSHVPKENVQVPLGWRFTLLDNVPVPGDPAGTLYAFPEMTPVTKEQLAECVDGGTAPVCALFADTKAIKVFKGGLPTRYALYRRLTLQPGAYRFTIHYFADAVDHYEGNTKIWANPGSALVQLCLEGAEYDSQHWQEAPIGQVAELSLNFVVPQARDVLVFANFHNPLRLDNNGWFIDNWLMQKTHEYDEATMAGRPSEHDCTADMPGALTND